MPLPATLFAPEFIRFDQVELNKLLNTLRDPITVHLYFLICTQCSFKTRELITNYPRLIELCTPPAPERGRRLSGPSLQQVRRAINWLVDARLVVRNAIANEAQGTLRLRVRPRDAKPRTKAKATG
jgi:hypothetical protein